jgi:retron-type reverse transcriptase
LAGRLAALEKVFSEAAMDRVWKKYVRPGLRDQEILDLYDFNDFHRDRKQIFAKLHTSICSGRYSPHQSIPVRIEKRLGVTRTIVLPAPEDCIVLQCIVEAILPEALKRQPSKNSFFSRSHGFSEAKFSFDSDYIWFKRWAKFSNIRFEIMNTYSYVCVTDIANYFDNIDYSHLRNIVSSLNDIDEVTLDILFSVLDRISWRPDYLPSPERSLPQVNFDAPRLLSHIYLYEVDAYLKQATSNSFVRWVDDMTIAVNSFAEGKALLRDLDHLLMTRGLRLNAGKTQILSTASARKFFHSMENQFLDEMKVRLTKYGASSKTGLRLLARIRDRFDAFKSLPSYGHADKVVKRYLTHFAANRDAHAVRFAASTMPFEPGLRESVFRYFRALGASRTTFNAMRDYATGADILDDASLMLLSKTLTEWHVKPNSALHRDIRSLGEMFGSAAYVEKNPFFFVSSLWLLAKYGMRKHIKSVIDNNFDVWSHSEFFARQVASTYGKFRYHKEGELIRKRVEQLRFTSANSVFSSFDKTAVAPGIDVRLYILNGRNLGSYSIQRFLTCLHVLTSTKIDVNFRKDLKAEVPKYMDDPIYMRVINRIRI